MPPQAAESGVAIEQSSRDIETELGPDKALRRAEQIGGERIPDPEVTNDICLRGEAE